MHIKTRLFTYVNLLELRNSQWWTTLPMVRVNWAQNWKFAVNMAPSPRLHFIHNGRSSKNAVNNVPADGKKKRSTSQEKLQHLHVQYAQASTHRHWYIQQDHKHQDLFYCRWSFTFGSLQQALNHQQSQI